MIDKYIFGYIKINGEEFLKDVIIIGEEVYHPWWRKEGHSVSIEDLEYPINKGIKEIVIGTGYYGFVKIDKELIEELRKKDIKIESFKTQEAVKLYNNLDDEERKKKAFCLHLTC
uniref:Uncharacterized protein n=1 Tax=candidate division WOR-3 bacterium TaxID=2052148 RepID=A0A7C4U6B4_UNCW3